MPPKTHTMSSWQRQKARRRRCISTPNSARKIGSGLNFRLHANTHVIHVPAAIPKQLGPKYLFHLTSDRFPFRFWSRSQNDATERADPIAHGIVPFIKRCHPIEMPGRTDLHFVTFQQGSVLADGREVPRVSIHVSMPLQHHL